LNKKPLESENEKKVSFAESETKTHRWLVFSFSIKSVSESFVSEKKKKKKTLAKIW
jgi:hypothetical protein